jgi:hypothetical protein
MKMSKINLNLEHDKWVASEYVEPQEQSDGYLSVVFGKLAGSWRQYELFQTEESKWKTWSVKMKSLDPIFGSSPKEVLEAVRKIDEPELEGK